MEQDVGQGARKGMNEGQNAMDNMKKGYNKEAKKK
jgi:hypothetical protein